MAKITQLKRGDENIYPLVHMDGVVDDNGNSISTMWDTKQETLVSGNNIKTVNGTSLLGSGDLAVVSVNAGDINVLQSTGDSQVDVMSQKAVTDAIGDISNKVNLPSTAVMNDNKYTSVKKYNISNLMNVWYIEKGLAKRALSWGWRNDLWFTLWKDSRNYFGVYRNDSSVKARLVVNNSVIQTENLVAAQAYTTNSYASVAFCIDLNRKVISCYSISSGALTTVGSVDISTWDLSSFSEVSIYNNAFGHNHFVACDRVVINDYFDIEKLLKYQFEDGRYNTLSNEAKQDPVIIPHTSLLVGGTVTSEISNVHKISNVTNNNGAFKLGPSVATGAKGRYFVKFKITSGTCKVTLGNGAAPILLDSNFNYLRTLTNVQSALENDTIYVLVFAVNGSSISAAVTSFLRAYGSFTIETLDCGAFITQSMNVCAETFDGQYYIGNIPFKATSSSWVNEINWDTNDNTTWNGIAKYARYVNASGNIMMFNGTVWKQINNS